MSSMDRWFYRRKRVPTAEEITRAIENAEEYRRELRAKHDASWAKILDSIEAPGMTPEELQEMREEILNPRERVPGRGSRHIPNDVRAEAMRRAGGRCVECGAEQDLAFDHIIPYSKGGSSTNSENIQVLCGSCNRRKRDRVGI